MGGVFFRPLYEMYKSNCEILVILYIYIFAHWVYHNICKAEVITLMKGSEEMEELTARQTVRLIEWLRSKGFTEEQIVECIEHINK